MVYPSFNEGGNLQYIDQIDFFEDFIFTKIDMLLFNISQSSNEGLKNTNTIFDKYVVINICSDGEQYCKINSNIYNANYSLRF